MTSAVRIVGFWSAITTTFLTLGTFIIAFFTPPLAGPGCIAPTCYTYPYHDIVERFPRDYYWMYPAILLYISYLILVVSIHHTTQKELNIFSHLGVIFASFAAGLFITNFFVQLSIIQPSLVLGETDGIALWSQFNPHGIFIVLEEIAYICMSIAFLFLAQVFSFKSKLSRWIKGVFITNFILTTFAFAGYTFAYGIMREYRFEIATISINWLTLLITCPMLAILFKRFSQTRLV